MIKKPWSVESKVILLVAAALVIVVSVVVIFTASGEEAYWRDWAPNGWYKQRNLVYPEDVRNGTIFFPICDHAYLGPLHGYFAIKDGVVFEERARYFIRIEGGVIAEVYPYRNPWDVLSGGSDP